MAKKMEEIKDVSNISGLRVNRLWLMFSTRYFISSMAREVSLRVLLFCSFHTFHNTLIITSVKQRQIALSRLRVLLFHQSSKEKSWVGTWGIGSQVDTISQTPRANRHSRAQGAHWSRTWWNKACNPPHEANLRWHGDVGKDVSMTR